MPGELYHSFLAGNPFPALFSRITDVDPTICPVYIRLPATGIFKTDIQPRVFVRHQP